MKGLLPNQSQQLSLSKQVIPLGRFKPHIPTHSKITSVYSHHSKRTFKTLKTKSVDNSPNSSRDSQHGSRKGSEKSKDSVRAMRSSLSDDSLKARNEKLLSKFSGYQKRERDMKRDKDSEEQRQIRITTILNAIPSPRSCSKSSHEPAPQNPVKDVLNRSQIQHTGYESLTPADGVRYQMKMALNPSDNTDINLAPILRNFRSNSQLYTNFNPLLTPSTSRSQTPTKVTEPASPKSDDESLYLDLEIDKAINETEVYQSYGIVEVLPFVKIVQGVGRKQRRRCRVTQSVRDGMGEWFGSEVENCEQSFRSYDGLKEMYSDMIGQSMSGQMSVCESDGSFPSCTGTLYEDVEPVPPSEPTCSHEQPPSPLRSRNLQIVFTNRSKSMSQNTLTRPIIQTNIPQGPSSQPESPIKRAKSVCTDIEPIKPRVLTKQGEVIVFDDQNPKPKKSKRKRRSKTRSKSKSGKKRKWKQKMGGTRKSYDESLAEGSVGIVARQVQVSRQRSQPDLMRRHSGLSEKVASSISHVKLSKTSRVKSSKSNISCTRASQISVSQAREKPSTAHLGRQESQQVESTKPNIQKGSKQRTRRSKRNADLSETRGTLTDRNTTFTYDPLKSTSYPKLPTAITQLPVRGQPPIVPSQSKLKFHLNQAQHKPRKTLQVPPTKKFMKKLSGKKSKPRFTQVNPTQVKRAREQVRIRSKSKRSIPKTSIGTNQVKRNCLRKAQKSGKKGRQKSDFLLVSPEKFTEEQMNDILPDALEITNQVVQHSPVSFQQQSPKLIKRSKYETPRSQTSSPTSERCTSPPHVAEVITIQSDILTTQKQSPENHGRVSDMVHLQRDSTLRESTEVRESTERYTLNTQQDDQDTVSNPQDNPQDMGDQFLAASPEGVSQHAPYVQSSLYSEFDSLQTTTMQEPIQSSLPSLADQGQKVRNQRQLLIKSKSSNRNPTLRDIQKSTKIAKLNSSRANPVIPQYLIPKKFKIQTQRTESKEKPRSKSKSKSKSRSPNDFHKRHLTNQSSPNPKPSRQLNNKQSPDNFKIHSARRSNARSLRSKPNSIHSSANKTKKLNSNQILNEISKSKQMIKSQSQSQMKIFARKYMKKHPQEDMSLIDMRSMGQSTMSMSGSMHSGVQGSRSMIGFDRFSSSSGGLKKMGMGSERWGKPKSSTRLKRTLSRLLASNRSAEKIRAQKIKARYPLNTSRIENPYPSIHEKTSKRAPKVSGYRKRKKNAESRFKQNCPKHTGEHPVDNLIANIETMIKRSAKKPLLQPGKQSRLFKKRKFKPTSSPSEPSFHHQHKTPTQFLYTIPDSSHHPTISDDYQDPTHQAHTHQPDTSGSQGPAMRAHHLAQNSGVWEQLDTHLTVSTLEGNSQHPLNQPEPQQNPLQIINQHQI